MNYFRGNPSQYKGIIFTDFDGTLFNKDRYITDKNYESLLKARALGFLTVIDTGRSLFSFRRVAEKLSKPIYEYFDYLIFSSGAGIIKCSKKLLGNATSISANELIESSNLEKDIAEKASLIFFNEGIDFMIHQKVPENHRFVYIKSNGNLNPDYYRRLKIYRDFANSLKIAKYESETNAIRHICNTGVSQLVGVVSTRAGRGAEDYHQKLYEYFKKKIDGTMILRTTSPIDKKSLWIEVFSKNVSKAKAAQRLALNFHLTAKESLAIGNDFNDEDMLAWASTGRVVDNSPKELKERFSSCGKAEENGVSNAILDFIN